MTPAAPRRGAAEPSLPFKSRRRTASSHRAEMWEWWKRGRRGTEGDVAPRVGEHDREYRGWRERERDARGRERKCDDARKQRQGCSYAEGAGPTRSERKHRIQESGGGGEEEREEGTKKGRRRRRNASALSAWATRRKKEDGNGMREGRREREENERGWLREWQSWRMRYFTLSLSLSLSDFSLLFHLPPFNPSLRFLRPFITISLAFHSSRSYLTVCTLRFLTRAIFSSTSSLFRHISRSFLGRSREPRPILLTLRASSTATCSGAHRPRKRERIICVTERRDYRRKTSSERSSRSLWLHSARDNKFHTEVSYERKYIHIYVIYIIYKFYI